MIEKKARSFDKRELYNLIKIWVKDIVSGNSIRKYDSDKEYLAIEDFIESEQRRFAVKCLERVRPQWNYSTKAEDLQYIKFVTEQGAKIDALIAELEEKA